MRIDTSLIPRYVREEIGNILLRGFMESIQDPEKKRRYDELGRAFLERRLRRKEIPRDGDGVD